MHVRPYDPCAEADWLHQFWLHTLDAKWALTAVELHQRLLSSAICLVVEDQGLPVGFCAGELGIAGKAHVLMLLIAPHMQRRGFGTALLSCLENLFRAEGVVDISVGGGANYFWPGIPAAEDIWPFFSKQGWQEQERCADLVLALDDFAVAPWRSGRLRDADVTVRPATLDMASSLLRFEREHFPAWMTFFENALRRSRFGNVLVAQDATNEIVGTVLLSDAESVTWRQSLGTRCGSLALLGVRPDRRTQGIGLALAACSAEILKDRGCSTCFIGWTGLIDWYGQLGATVWSEYVQATKRLAPNICRPALQEPADCHTAAVPRPIPQSPFCVPKRSKVLESGLSC